MLTKCLTVLLVSAIGSAGIVLGSTTGCQRETAGEPSMKEPGTVEPSVVQHNIPQPAKPGTGKFGVGKFGTGKFGTGNFNIPEVRIPEIDFQGVRVQSNDDLTVISLPADILFNFDKDILRSDARVALEQVQQVLTKRFPSQPLRIQGHTDAKGSDDYNQNLSERRARAVERWLGQRGVAFARMTTVGFGETQPVAPNTRPDGSDNPAGRQQNRRVEIAIEK